MSENKDKENAISAKVPSAKGSFGDAAYEGLMGGVQSVVEAAGTAVDWVGGGFERPPGDQGYAASWYKTTENLVNSDGHKFDMRMAVGWQPEGPIKYNGVMMNTGAHDKLPPITNMLAIFVRHENGDVEILDPTTKVESLPELVKMPWAFAPESFWDATLNPFLGKDLEYVTDSDREWQKYGGANILGQIAPMFAGGVFSAGAKGTTVVATQLPGLTGAFTNLSTGLNTVSKLSYGLGAANGVAGVSQIASMVQEIGMREDAYKDISEAFKNPENVTAKIIRHAVNDALHEYSYKHGSEARQIYIPSVKDHENPWDRLDELSRGSIKSEKKSTTPWDDADTKYRNTDTSLRDNLANDSAFAQAFHTIAHKVFTGKPVTDNEVLTLRFGINTFSVGNNAFLDTDFQSVRGEKFTNDHIEYTPQEREETFGRLRQFLTPAATGQFMATDIASDESLAKFSQDQLKLLGEAAEKARLQECYSSPTFVRFGICANGPTPIP